METSKQSATLTSAAHGSGAPAGALAYGNGGPRNSSPGTLTRLFFDACAKHDRPNALQYKQGGAYHPISHRELLQRVRHCALGLDELGIRPGDRVAILSENRPEWAIADYACLTSSLTDVPIYPTLPPEQIAYMLRDSGAVAIFCSTAVQSAKIASMRGECPALTRVIGFGASVNPGEDMTLAEVEARGAAVDSPERQARYRERSDSVRPDDVATLIYTSGTTGEPKGVQLTHDNLFSNVAAGASAIPFHGDDTCLSFLPLSHVFERMSGHYLMLHAGASIAYAESIESVPVNLGEVHPTIVLSVPRLFEKMYSKVLDNALAGGTLKARIFFWARKVADRWADETLAGRTPGGLLAMKYAIAQRLVFSKLKTRTGGRLRYFVSGGAPLSPEINKFFYAAGLTILEGYGLTETSPLITVNTPDRYRIGTVGPIAPGVEVAIAADGEILTRGPNVMKGYFNKPEATAEVIDRDGWFHTGDIGVLEDGFLRITDRKKDLIVTAGGKNIAPQPIENRVKTNKFVTQVVMIGDKRKYPILLIVPNWDSLEPWAAQNGLGGQSRAELIASPQVRTKVEQEVKGQLSGLAHFEMPKKIGLLEHDFSIERGELTPKMSVKRRVVDKNYKAVIDRLYGGSDGAGASE
jgi:long-chain acyl-CoA synthetase